MHAVMLCPLLLLFEKVQTDSVGVPTSLRPCCFGGDHPHQHQPTPKQHRTHPTSLLRAHHLHLVSDNPSFESHSPWGCTNCWCCWTKNPSIGRDNTVASLPHPSKSSHTSKPSTLLFPTTKCGNKFAPCLDGASIPPYDNIYRQKNMDPIPWPHVPSYCWAILREGQPMEYKDWFLMHFESLNTYIPRALNCNGQLRGQWGTTGGHA